METRENISGRRKVQPHKSRRKGKTLPCGQGEKVSVLKLENDSIFVNCNVNCNDILAIEDFLDWDIRMMRKFSGVADNEIYNVKLEGTGMVAITAHQDPLTFRVTREYPFFTSPNATVAWSGNLEPEIKTDISLKTLIEKSSGESVQMVFRGEGFVVVQPCEEVYSQTQLENKVSNIYIS